MRKPAITALLLGSALFLFAGCSQERPKPVPHEKVQGSIPVSLPDRPIFETVLTQTEPKKGVYTPWGAIFHQQTLMDQEIRVSGEIVAVSDDCPALTAPQTNAKQRGGRAPDPAARKCNGLSVKIASPDHRHRTITVVGYHPFYHPHLEVGMTLDVTGKYVRFGNSMGHGYVQYRDGLILTKELHQMGVDKSGYFTTDRSEISSMIAKGSLLTAPKNY